MERRRHLCTGMTQDFWGGGVGWGKLGHIQQWSGLPLGSEHWDLSWHALGNHVVPRLNSDGPLARQVPCPLSYLWGPDLGHFLYKLGSRTPSLWVKAIRAWWCQTDLGVN